MPVAECPYPFVTGVQTTTILHTAGFVTRYRLHSQREKIARTRPPFRLQR